MAMTTVDPRVVGGRYWSAYWRETYTVEGIDSVAEGGCPWLTVRWDKGGTTVHRTLWDTRDRVLGERARCEATFVTITGHTLRCHLPAGHAGGHSFTDDGAEG